MIIYNSKRRDVREVTLIPNSKWGGQGLLGVSIKFSSFEGAEEKVWHVLDVSPNSPADIAGFRAHTDYIVGADQVMCEDDDLKSLVEAHEGKELKFFVYNSLEDRCREVIIVPNRFVYFFLLCFFRFLF